jgi:hypothetical protein
MKKLTIVANIYADPSRIELVKAELEKLIHIATITILRTSYSMKIGSLVNCGKPI